MSARVSLSIEEYTDELLGLVEPIADVLMEPFTRTRGRTLGEAVVSRGPVPAFASSAMDGFALHHADLAPGAVLTEVADVPTGAADDPVVSRGACARIRVGAPVPTSCDTVIPRELVTELQGGVRIDEIVAAGAHVRHPGEDLAAGDAVLQPGHVLDARALSLVAACGQDEVGVVRRPVVTVGTTGEALVAPGRELGRGQTYDSNGTFLAEALRRDGAEVLRVGTLPAEPDAVAAGLEALARHADLVVLSGGVSGGDPEVVRGALGDGAEKVVVRHVHVQPGEPQAWAHWRTASGRVVPVVALPGDPFSTAVSYELFVRPLVARLLGQPLPSWETVIAAEGWHSPAGRRQILPALVERDPAGGRRVRPVRLRGGSPFNLVSTLALADGLVAVHEAVTEVAPGDILPYRSLS